MKKIMNEIVELELCKIHLMEQVKELPEYYRDSYYMQIGMVEDKINYLKLEIIEYRKREKFLKEVKEAYYKNHIIHKNFIIRAFYKLIIHL